MNNELYLIGLSALCFGGMVYSAYREYRYNRKIKIKRFYSQRTAYEWVVRHKITIFHIELIAVNKQHLVVIFYR